MNARTSLPHSAKPDRNIDASFTRRAFVKITAGATLAAGLFPRGLAAESQHGIPYRTLGHTGEKVSLLGLGGSHIGVQDDEQESIRLIRTALDQGVNFLDNCWDYNGGASEERMGKALRDGYRAKAFLMSKIDGRTRDTAAKQIDESLKRLGTDHIDLMQFHEIIRMEDPDLIFAEGAAMAAMMDAKKAGKVRYIGFTGHKSPTMHLKMLEVARRHDFKFATVQMPLNVMDAHYESFEKQVLPELKKQDIGVLGMKPMGAGIILKTKTVSPVECLHYAMNLPTSVVITGCEKMEVLQQALDAARSFKPMNETQVAQLLAKTEKAAQKGESERYKTSAQFDGTVANPHWLG